MADLIARDALGTLTRLGQGGQGVVYQAPKVKAKFADRMVFKEYKPQARGEVDFEALSAMPTLVEETLSHDDGKGLVSVAAWPCALVEGDTGPVGFVMPAIPDSFQFDLTTVKGRSPTISEFQHLLNPASVLAARGITITDEQRYQLVREVAKALSFLHRIGVCVGDISPKNVLFSLEPRPAVYFVDCDTMRVNGVSALLQRETPEWQVPAGEELATIYSDTYKLGLLALRLLVGDQHTKNPQDLPATTPKPLRQLITDTLTKEPADRPVPQAWDYLLGQIIDNAQQKTTTLPIDPPRPASPSYSLEPTPVVRTRTIPSTQTPTTTVSTSSVAVSRPRWRPKHTAILAASILVVSALVGILVTMQHDRSPRAIFDGTFTATYGTQSTFNGRNPQTPEPSASTLTWVVRSACNGVHCVAAATTKNRPGGELKITFDYADGLWTAVYTREDIDCGGTEMWGAFSLAATTGGSMSGEYRFAHADGNECNGKRPVTFNRIGDPDPSIRTLELSQLEARKSSPAEALHGSYHYTQTYDKAGDKYEYDYSATTLCLRSGERCITVFFNSDGQQAFIFFGGLSYWTRTLNTDGSCRNGQPNKQQMSITLPLPDPQQNPITMLTGRGTLNTLTQCAGSQTFDVALTRTGD